MTTYLDTVHFDAYVHGCAARCGVRVEWDKAGSVPRTDGKTLWLPHITSKDSPDYLTNLRYFVKHETSHVVHTDFDYWQKKGCQGLLHFIANILEDNRIDYLNDKEFPGDVRLSNEWTGVYVKKLNAIESETSDDQKLLAPLFAWESEHRHWVGEWPQVGKWAADRMDIIGKKRYAKLMAGNYGERLLSLRNSDKGATDDLFELAKSILEDIYEEDSSKYQKPQDGSGKGKGEGKGKGGKESKDGEGEGSPVSDDVDRIITVDKLTAALSSDHLQPSRTGVHLEHDVSYGSYSIPSRKDYHVITWPSPRTPEGWSRSGYFNKRTVDSIIDGNAKPLSNKLRIKLQVRSKGHYEYGVKSGKLHTGSLHRLVSARGTEAESRVFRRHVTTDTLDSAVSLLVDCSGSMSGEKFEMACASAAAVSLALKPLRIPHAVFGFTNTARNEDPIIWTFKGWHETLNQQSFVDRFAIASGALWQNSDGDAIAWTFDNIRQRKEKRKVIIVLSDGSPAGRSHAGDISAYTKKVVSSIEDSKAAEIYGVGIMDSNVRLYYKKHVVLNNAGNLAGTLLSIIDKAL